MNRKFAKYSNMVLIILVTVFLQCQPTLAQVKKAIIFPLAFHGDASKAYLQQGLQSMLISRLSDPNIEIIGDEGVKTLLKGQEGKVINTPEKAASLGRLAGADYALFGSITGLGSNYSLDIAVLNLGGARPEPHWISKTVAEDQFFARVEELAKDAKDIMGSNTTKTETAPPEQKPIPKTAFAASPATAPEKAPEASIIKEKPPQDEIVLQPSEDTAKLAPIDTLPLEIEIMAAAQGDLDGDGQMELVVLSRKELVIYTRKENRFVLNDRMKPSFGVSFIKLSVGDGDGNGIDEIYIVEVSGGQARSSVWEWTGKFEKRYELGGHLRITSVGDKKKPIILFQKSLSRAKDFFTGPIWVMGQGKSGVPDKQKPLAVPKGTQFYTVAFADIDGDGSMETLSLGQLDIRERGCLTLSSDGGEILWQSTETYGGTNNLVLVEEWGSDTHQIRIPLNPSPVFLDKDGDGSKEVVVVRNLSSAEFMSVKTYSKSVLTFFKTEGKAMKPMLTSGENDYPVMDMYVEKDELFIATHKPPLSSFSKRSGRILQFK